MIERSALRRNAAREGRHEEVLVEGPSKRDAATLTARTRQGKPVHFAPRRGRRRGGLVLRGRDHPRRAAPPARRAGGGHRPTTTPHEDPDRRTMTARLALVGPTASGKSAAAHARGARSRRRRDRLARRDGRLPRDGPRDGEADGRHARRGPLPPRRRPRSHRGAHRAALPGPLRGGGGRGRGPGSRRAPRRRLGAVPARRGRRAHHPADGPRGPRGAGGRGTRAGGREALFAELERVDPMAAARIEPGNARRVVRALEVVRATGRAFSSYGEGLDRYGATDVELFGITLDPVRTDAAIEARFDSWMAAGLLDELRGLLAGPGGLSRTARQAAAATASCSGTSRTTSRSPRRRGRRRRHAAARASASGAGSGGTRGSAGSPDASPPRLARAPSHAERYGSRDGTGRLAPMCDTAPSGVFEKWHGAGNDFLVALRRRPGAPRARRRGGWCDRHTGIGADGLIEGTFDARGLVMSLHNADGTAAEVSGNGLRCLVAAARRPRARARGHASTSRRTAGARRVTVALDLEWSTGWGSVDMGEVAGDPAGTSRPACVRTSATPTSSSTGPRRAEAELVERARGARVGARRRRQRGVRDRRRAATTSRSASSSAARAHARVRHRLVRHRGRGASRLGLVEDA